MPNVNKLEEKNEQKLGETNSNNELRIAWRYGQQQSNEPIASTNNKILQPNYFFMNKFMNMNDEVLTASNVKMFNMNTAELKKTNYYAELISDIESHVDSLNMNINKTKSYTNILRIGLKFLVI